MTDAERLAKVMGNGPHQENWDELAQRLIDSGVVTVNPPPNPAEQILTEFTKRWWESRCTAPVVFRSMLDDGWITPGPRCEGVDPDPRDAVVEAAAAWVAADGNATTSEASRQYAVLCDAVHDWTGGGRRG